MKRRSFLTTTAAGAAGLAGCSNLLEGDATTSTPTATESEPEYELEFSGYEDGDTVDLSSLPLEPTDYTEEDVYEDFGFEIQYEVLKDGEPLDPESISLEAVKLDGSEPEEYRDEHGRIQLPCTATERGESTVAVEVAAEGKTHQAETTIEKLIPENYRLEPFVKGEPLTPEYSTVFEFDTQNLDKEEFYEKREKATRSVAELNSTPRNVLSSIDEERLQNVLESDEFSEIEKKRRALFYISADVAKEVGWSSIHAEAQSSHEELAMKELTPYDDIFTCGFDNPKNVNYGTGGHGSKVAYVGDRNSDGGDWYHLETIGTETVHITNMSAETVDMMQDPESDDNHNGDYVSILGEFYEGNMDEISFRKKLDSMTSLFIGQTLPGGDVTIKEMYLSDPFASNGLKMIRNNEQREDIMEPLEVAADHHLETGQVMSVFGTPDEPVIYATKEDDIHIEMINDLGIHDPEAARDWLTG